jgi:hypothetical protein
VEWQNDGIADGMAEWWNGGMAELPNGNRMAEWRNGNGMAEWCNCGMVEWQVAEWRDGGRNGGISGMVEWWNGGMAIW